MATTEIDFTAASNEELQKVIAHLRTQLQLLTEKKDAPAPQARRGSREGQAQPSSVRRELKDSPDDTEKAGTQLSGIQCFTPVLVHSSKWKTFFWPKNRLQLHLTGEALTFELDLNALNDSSPSPSQGGSSRLEWWKEVLLTGNCVRKRYQMQASPLSALTLYQQEREQFGVPSKSCWFCYCYPIEALRSYIARGQDTQEDPVQPIDWPLVLWLLYGAFVYFDAKLEILRINAVSFHQRPDLPHMTTTDQSEGEGVVRSFPLRMHPNPMRSLSYRFLDTWRRWCALPVAPVPMSELKKMLQPPAPTASSSYEEATSEPESLRIAWINPSEVLGDDVFSMFGGFAFASLEEAGKESAKYFAIDCERVLAQFEKERENAFMPVEAEIDKAVYSEDEGGVDEGEEKMMFEQAMSGMFVEDHISPMHSASPQTTRKWQGPQSEGAGVPLPVASPSGATVASPSGPRAGSRSKSAATVTGLIDVSIEIAEQLQDALLKHMSAAKAKAGQQTKSEEQCVESLNKDPSTWTEEFLKLPATARLSSSASPSSNAREELKARVKFFAKLHLQVGLPLRVPVPIKLLALTGFGGGTKQLSFKECLWAQDKHDLAHSNGCRVLFHLSAHALQQEDEDTKEMLRGAFKDLGTLLNPDAQKSGVQPLLQLRASPLNAVNLPEFDRIKAGIPASAVFYSFCYPHDKSQHNPNFCACDNKFKPCSGANSTSSRERVSLNCPTVLKKELLTLLLRGGFLYFDATYDIVAVNAWTSDEHASTKNLLHFGPSVTLPWSAHKALAVFGRWREVTHEAADKHGFAEMAWINPYEVIADHIFSRYGGLAFFKRRPATDAPSQETSAGYLSDEGPGTDGQEAEGVFYPIVLGSSECLDVEAYEKDFSPKPYDMAIDFPVMGVNSDVEFSGKFGSNLTRAPSGKVDLVQFHEETKQAAWGIKGLFGEESAADKLSPLEAIRREFETPNSWITKKDIENMQYVLDCEAEEKLVDDNTESGAKMIQDKGNNGRTLDGFCKMPQAKNANLEKHEVAALRIYTTSSFHCINDPLRIQTPKGEKQHPHPLPKTTRFIYGALKKMRAVHLEKGSSFRPRYLWRGMRNLQVDDVFMRHGGTELACMSTSEDINIVAKYCQCEKPLIFRIRVASPMDLGADISWLSCFPHEKEVLYPPLTYLKPLYRQEIKSKDKGSVITVEVRFPS